MTPGNNISLLTTSGIEWNVWNSSPDFPPLLTFLDPVPLIAITPDTYRLEAMRLLNDIVTAGADAENTSNSEGRFTSEDSDLDQVAFIAGH